MIDAMNIKLFSSIIDVYDIVTINLQLWGSLH